MDTLQTEVEEGEGEGEGEGVMIFTFDVSDEALEIAGMVGDTINFTWGVCTMDQPGCPA
jgi:hypothetical protein